MPPTFLNTIEQTTLSTWLRDSPSIFGFWFVLSFHALGLAMVTGSSALIDLRTLGVAKDLPLATMKRLNPFLWTGFWIQILTGALLLLAYPTKSLTTLDFYLKLTFIAAAMIVTVRLQASLAAARRDATPIASDTRLAILSLIFWIGAITAGRFIGYVAKYATYPQS